MKTKEQEMPKFKPFGPCGELSEADCDMIVLALGSLVGSFGLDKNRELSPTAKAASEAARKFGVTV